MKPYGKSKVLQSLKHLISNEEKLQNTWWNRTDVWNCSAVSITLINILFSDIKDHVCEWNKLTLHVQ